MRALTPIIPVECVTWIIKRCQTSSKENIELLPCTSKHKADVQQKINGVKNDCVFSRIPGFDLFMCIMFDPMHDLLEGLCRYELGEILYHLIFVNKLVFFRCLEK